MNINPPPLPGVHNKRIEKTVFSLGMFFAGIIGVASILIMIAGWDIAPPDTTDLTPERIELPTEQNAFTFFELATNSFYWPTNAAVVTDFLDGKPVDDELIKETISRNTNMMEIVSKGLECQRCITPEVTSFDTPTPYLAPWRNMGRIMANNTKHERLAGKYAEATRSCISLLRYGNLIQKDAECLINYLVGIAVFDIGFTQAQDLARDSGTPFEELARLSEALPHLGPFDHGLVRAIKVENRIIANTIDQLRAGKLGGVDIFDSGDGKTNSFWKSKKIPSYIFQPNKTKLIFANLNRDMITNTALPYASMNRYDAEDMLGLKGSTTRLMIWPNSMGRILFGLLIPSYGSLLEKKCRSECSLAATRIIVACKIYQKKEGKLPADLQSLVPLYLPSIPVDPYDGKPLRYSPSKGIIYSVSQDLKDSGGSVKLRDRDKEDPSPKKRWETEDAVYEINARIQSQQH